MARKLRLEYPGAIYHVMNRGDHRAKANHDVGQMDGQAVEDGNLDAFEESLARQWKGKI